MINFMLNESIMLYIRDEPFKSLWVCVGGFEEEKIESGFFFVVELIFVVWLGIWITG